MHAIHKLPHNLVNMATSLDIFGVYIQTLLIGCLTVLAFAQKTTITAFCTHFLPTLKKIPGVPKHTKIRDSLIALNKIHPLYTIQNVYKSIYTKLAEWKLIDKQQIIAKQVEEVFY